MLLEVLPDTPTILFTKRGEDVTYYELTATEQGLAVREAKSLKELEGGRE